MTSILIGNGINIQFGGQAYSSSFILKRMKFRAFLEHYNQLFEDTITGRELAKLLNGFVDVANRLKSGDYDNVVDEGDKNLLDAISDFKNRYTWTIEQPHDIMLEDWFLLFQIFLRANPDFLPQKVGLLQGFERLILDGIYNGGKIQEIHKAMNKKVKRFFSSFDNVFTLNYDNNIEKLTGKPVYHLHGDFSVLADSENLECAQGYLREQRGERVVIPGWEHCFCNALLNYSGTLKLKRADGNHRAIVMSETWGEKYKDYDVVESKQAQNAVESSLENAIQLIQTKVEHPELYIASEYHFEDLRNITGDLTIIGMSPNNDSHIFDIIDNNPGVEKIKYYFFSKSERNSASSLFKNHRCECLSIIDLWEELECSQKIYHCNYPDLPKAIPQLGESISLLSDDIISNEKLINEANRIPQYQVDRLTALVDAKMNEFDLDNHDETEVDRQRRTISFVALQEGVLPAVLYTLYIMNTKNRNRLTSN